MMAQSNDFLDAAAVVGPELIARGGHDHRK